MLRFAEVFADPDIVSAVRRQLSWTHIKTLIYEASEIFGGGVNAFSRYETGKTKPSLALVKLLKVFDRHPDLLNEIRAA